MITTKEAIEHLIEQLETDVAYRTGWQANIAMAFFDEMEAAQFPGDRYTVHAVANKAAERFLKLLCYKPATDESEGD